MSKGNCETCGHWDDDLVDGMCLGCTDKYINHEQHDPLNMKTEIKQLPNNKVLFCISPDQHGAQCQSMTREELAGIRDSINQFFLGK